MKSIAGIWLSTIVFSGVFGISAESSWALNVGDNSLEGQLERKLEEGLLKWIRHLYSKELKYIINVQTKVTLIPGKLEYTLVPENDEYEIWTPYQGWTLAVKLERMYKLKVSTDFVRLFETEDALFAYAGILAQGKKIFDGRIADLLKESQIWSIAGFMIEKGKNPYGYLRFIEHLYSFLHSGEKIDPSLLSKAKELLHDITGVEDNQEYSSLPANLLMKSYLEKKMQLLAEKLGMSDNFISFKMDLSENDALGLYISGESDRQMLFFELPKGWSKILANEDQFVALIVYTLLWNQEAKNGPWGPDSVKKLDFKVVDTLLSLDLKNSLDLECSRGYNPSEYYKLLTQIDRNRKKFAGLFQQIERTLKTSQIDPNTRISAVQAYLWTLETKHADAFGQIYPFQLFAQKNTAQKAFKPKRTLNRERYKAMVEVEEEKELKPKQTLNPEVETEKESKPKQSLNPEVETEKKFKLKQSLNLKPSKPISKVQEETENPQSTVSYEKLISYLSDNQENPNLDVSASQLIKLLPETELTLSVLTNFYEEQKNRLPISVLTMLNTFLSRQEESDINYWIHLNSVYEMIRVSLVGQSKNPIPARICEEWEKNYLKLILIQIEQANLFIQDERSKLVKNLQSYSLALGPCSNSSSRDKIFKLLRSFDKFDLALMIEWDWENSYQNKCKSILKRKKVDDLNFLESPIFLRKNNPPSILAQEAIRKLPAEVLRINALDKLGLEITHESYLKALLRRAGKLYYDAENLLKLQSFVNRNPNLADSMRDQDRIRMNVASIRQGEVPPHSILLSLREYRPYMEKLVDALSEGRISHVDSLSLIVKKENNPDLIRRYLDQRPLRSIDELIEFINIISKYEHRELFSKRDVQYVFFQKISEQIADQEYSVANMHRLHEAVENSSAQLKLSGIHPIFLKALKVLEDDNQLAQALQILLKATDNDEAKWVMEISSRKDYLKAILAAIQAEEENLILEYPAISSTNQARDGVFDILMKSELSNEFIQKWIEIVFATQEQKEKFFEQLRKQRPALSLQDVANFLNQAGYGEKVLYPEMSSPVWNQLFSTVPVTEFTSEKVSQFSILLKEHPIPTLVMNGWYLKHTPKENTEQLVQIFESIRDISKNHSTVNKTFCNQIGSHFDKMMRAAARKNPRLLFESFTPAIFSLEGGEECTSKLNWEQKLYRIAKEEVLDSKMLLDLLIHRNQASLKEIESLQSTITYEEFTNYLINNQKDPDFKLDLSASQLVRLLPETELTFAVLADFFEKKKYQLPICALAMLNTFLSRLEETNLRHFVHWKSVYELVQNGIGIQAKHQIPYLICEGWEKNYLRLISTQIEGTNFSISEEKSKLINNLQNFKEVLGPCLNRSSQDRIFKLLKSSEKVDLAFMIEWDDKNSYQSKYKSVLKRKGVDNLNFLESNFLRNKSDSSVLAMQAIRKLPPEVLRLDALDNLSLETTHQSYLKALVQRAGELYDDRENLIKLLAYVNKNKELADAIWDHVRIRMSVAAIQQGEVLLDTILLPYNQNRLDMEKLVDALCESSYSLVDSLAFIVKMDWPDLIKYYLDQKPFRSFAELLEFINIASEAEYSKLFASRDVQYVIFQKISEQILDQEYSVANMILLQQAIEEISEQLKLSGIHPIFFKALKVIEDRNELAQVLRILLKTTDKNEAQWVMEIGSRKDYLKAVLAAFQVEDENLILEYPALSGTEQARDRVFDILMKSDLSNEFIQKWIESVFVGNITKSEERIKNKFLNQLREQRPACSLENVASFLNQPDYEAKVFSPWRDCKHLFRTVPSDEFTSEKVGQFIDSIKDRPIPTLAVHGWYLKHTRAENTDQLVQIFESIRDIRKKYSTVNKTFCSQIGSHFDKMIRAAARKNPELLFDSFTPEAFSLLGGGRCQSKVNWQQVIYRITKEEGVDSDTILSLLLQKYQTSQINDFFSDFYPDIDQYGRINILAHSKSPNLNDEIKSELIFSAPKKEITWNSISLYLSHIDSNNFNLRDRIARTLIYDLPKKDVTWLKVLPFANSFKDGSNAPVYAMLRLLELTEDPASLAGIHSFLSKYTTENQIKITSREVCQVLTSNFDKMVKGSFNFGSAFLELKAFTPIQLGCYSDLDSPSQIAIEEKYQFRAFIRAAEIGAIDQEGILIELKDSALGNSQQKFAKAIEQVKKIKPIESFKDLETLLISTEKRRNGFTLSGHIFEQVILYFPVQEFKRDKVQPVLKYLDAHDTRQILRHMQKVSHTDEDMDFVVREGLALMNEKRFEKTMLGSVRQDPENLFRFPILINKAWCQDSFIQGQLIEYWMSSDAPKEYLLAWLSFLPPELGKRDRALRHFIEKAGIRSLGEWTELDKRAEKVIESKKSEEQWLRTSTVKGVLWNDVTLPYLFSSLPSEPTSHEIVEFMKSQRDKGNIDRSFALNWALRRASSPEDYLELHTELLAIRNLVPPAFCKSSEYMKSYVEMIRAVMNRNPEEALNFYDMPIQENNLIQFFSADQARRKRYAVLDTLADNLVENCKSWPPGMAWVWITKFIPVIAEAKGEGLVSLFQEAAARPRTEPTEAIIQIAARRGILSFEDIPNEIESAKAIHPSFALEPQTQKVILERLPQESFTFKNLKSYADIDAVWTRQTLGESILAAEKLEDDDKKTLFELELEQRKDRPDLLENYLKTKKIITENPILTYDLENSEKMQKVFIDKMREGGAWPEENLIQQHEILFSLAKRGPSELTDELLYQLYKKDSFECAWCIRETMENHAFWDLHRRKEIYEIYLKIISKAFDEQSFKWDPEQVQEYAADIISTVNLFFPIPSMERSEILERLANDIRASEELTQQIEDEKTRGVNEDAALGLGLYLMNKVLNIYPGDHERMALVKFFVRNDELPEHIALRFRQQVGVDRLRRQFLELPAFGKALAINALIVNLLPKRAYREELEHMIWNNVQDEFRSMAKLFYRSFVKALQETAPFQESIFVSFLLGQLANVQGSHPGEKLKYILESLGGTGISIGQKIYQRRMIPDEYLEHLKNMTDHSPLPCRKAIYDRVKTLLDVPRVSQVLSVQEILGGASTALVVRVVFNDGKEAALKMTFENLPKRTQVEFRKMEAALNHLVEDGGSMYNRLWPVIQEVHDGLRGQEDLTQECEKTARMKSLYESDSNYHDKVQFKVIQTFPNIGKGEIPFVGFSSEHVFMELAKGKTLTRLSEDQKKKVFPEIFKKEMSILLADPNEHGLINFEKDRHMGNFIVDFNAEPAQISVYDYPLLSSITAKERTSLFRLIGWLEARRMYGINMIAQAPFDSKIAQLLATEIAEAPLDAGTIKKHLSKALAGKAETSEKLFAIFAIIDEVGTKDKIGVRPSLISYSVALGHAERYGQFIESTDKGGAFRELLTPHVENSDKRFSRIASTRSESVRLEETYDSFERLSEFK